MLWLYFAVAFLVCWIIYECTSNTWNIGTYNQAMMITSYIFLVLALGAAIGTIVSLGLELHYYKKHITMLHCKISPGDCVEKMSPCDRQMNNKMIERESRNMPKSNFRMPTQNRQTFAFNPVQPAENYELGRDQSDSF